MNLLMKILIMRISINYDAWHYLWDDLIRTQFYLRSVLLIMILTYLLIQMLIILYHNTDKIIFSFVFK